MSEVPNGENILSHILYTLLESPGNGRIRLRTNQSLKPETRQWDSNKPQNLNRPNGIEIWSISRRMIDDLSSPADDFTAASIVRPGSSNSTGNVFPASSAS